MNLRSNLRTGILLAALTAITGCSSGPATVNDFEVALGKVECQGKLACCAGMYPDEATCETAVAAGYHDKLAQVEADIAAGSRATTRRRRSARSTARARWWRAARRASTCAASSASW